MKVVFAGTPEFAALALTAIHEAGFEIPLVLTQPDRPAGRGMQLHPSPVKQLAQNYGIPVAQPESLRLAGKFPEAAAQAHQQLSDSGAEVMVVAAYGLILPPSVLDLPRFGCINIHASLLPRWRGAAPIHRAIEAGDHETGITIMQMDEGLDTGAMLRIQAEPILPDDTTGRLHDRLARLGGELIVQVLRDLQHTALQAQPQPMSGVSYAAKISKDEARLDFNLPASLLLQRIRAFNPAPGAFVPVREGTLKIWDARLLPLSGVPGTVLAIGPEGVSVACGEAALLLTELQKPGGKRQPAASFLQGFPLQLGQQLTDKS
jgi:methionyl-tRNA formyltransferase